jgi:hypothetical protein
MLDTSKKDYLATRSQHFDLIKFFLVICSLMFQVRRDVYRLTRIDSEPTEYSIFAKVEVGVTGSKLKELVAKAEAAFREALKVPPVVGAPNYPGKTYDTYSKFVGRWFYKICDGFEWRQPNTKWKPIRHSSRSPPEPAESAVDEVRILVRLCK